MGSSSRYGTRSTVLVEELGEGDLYELAMRNV